MITVPTSVSVSTIVIRLTGVSRASNDHGDRFRWDVTTIAGSHNGTCEGETVG
jgi:hypothetical protein